MARTDGPRNGWGPMRGDTVSGGRRVLVASNRGPVSYARDPEGHLVAKRGAGGLVTALTGAMDGSGGLWVAAAMSPEDRELAAQGRETMTVDGANYRVRLLTFPQRAFDRYYNGISNRVMWFLHHQLWDVPHSPMFDDGFRRDWSAYRDVNRAFAVALDEEAGPEGGPDDPLFLIQDYHLTLVPAIIRRIRPTARINHFSHIPFTGPNYFRILPSDVADELLAGLLGADVLGFQSDWWADNFLAVCQRLPNADVDFRRREVGWQGRTVRVAVYPISVDTDALRSQAEGDDVSRARRRLARWRGDAKLIVRVDRTDLSKNILRGFVAYQTFLRRNPRWRGRVKFLTLLNSSRGEIKEYRQYLKECLRAAGRVNSDFRAEGWEPIRVAVGDDFATVLAAYQLYDVLLVNPVYDGMNLVAKEGPLLNHRDGVLILSENAGASPELRPHAVGINPFDVAATAEAIGRALVMPPAERAHRAAGMREAVERNTAERWVRRQIADLDHEPTQSGTRLRLTARSRWAGPLSEPVAEGQRPLEWRNAPGVPGGDGLSRPRRGWAR